MSYFCGVHYRQPLASCCHHVCHCAVAPLVQLPPPITWETADDVKAAWLAVDRLAALLVFATSHDASAMVAKLRDALPPLDVGEPQPLDPRLLDVILRRGEDEDEPAVGDTVELPAEFFAALAKDDDE